MKQFKTKKAELITWLLFLISSFSLYFIATDHAIFPSKYKFPLLLVITALVCITGIISILAKRSFRYIAIALNVLLVIMVSIGLILLPNIENRVRNIFKDVRVDEAIINIYSLNNKYKENLSDYQNPVFITQKRNDQDNQSYAIEQLKEFFDMPSIKIVTKEDIPSAVEALYSGEGDLLILNEAYIDTVEEIEKFNEFSDDTKIVSSIIKQIEVKKEEMINRDVTNSLFTIYIAGEDTRSGRLSIYGRTDVDIIVNINPVTRQVMIVGIPRDTYIPNPALSYGYDKLTHLGNDGILNTMKGVSEYYDIDIDYYGVVNFNTFKYIVDAIDGVDVENPYYFSTTGENSTIYYYDEGTIHLNGTSALAYVRERKSLPNGDYGRSEHQTIVLKAIIRKLTSFESLNMYDDLLNALQGQFLTNMDVEDIYKLIAMQLNDNSSWDIISYHMGGEGDMQGTASMGWDRKLYVVHPFDSQVKFIRQETEKMKNDETISQQKLPNEQDTTYIPN